MHGSQSLLVCDRNCLFLAKRYVCWPCGPLSDVCSDLVCSDVGTSDTEMGTLTSVPCVCTGSRTHDKDLVGSDGGTSDTEMDTLASVPCVCTGSRTHDDQLYSQAIIPIWKSQKFCNDVSASYQVKVCTAPSRKVGVTKAPSRKFGVTLINGVTATIDILSSSNKAGSVVYYYKQPGGTESQAEFRGVLLPLDLFLTQKGVRVFETTNNGMRNADKRFANPHKAYILREQECFLSDVCKSNFAASVGLSPYVAELVRVAEETYYPMPYSNKDCTSKELGSITALEGSAINIASMCNTELVPSATESEGAGSLHHFYSLLAITLYSLLAIALYYSLALVKKNRTQQEEQSTQEI